MALHIIFIIMAISQARDGSKEIELGGQNSVWVNVDLIDFINVIALINSIGFHKFHRFDFFYI